MKQLRPSNKIVQDNVKICSGTRMISVKSRLTENNRIQGTEVVFLRSVTEEFTPK